MQIDSLRGRPVVGETEAALWMRRALRNLNAWAGSDPDRLREASLALRIGRDAKLEEMQGAAGPKYQPAS